MPVAGPPSGSACSVAAVDEQDFPELAAAIEAALATIGPIDSPAERVRRASLLMECLAGGGDRASALRDQALLHLVDAADMTYRDISAVTGLTHPRIAQIVKRARQVAPPAT